MLVTYAGSSTKLNFTVYDPSSVSVVLRDPSENPIVVRVGNDYRWNQSLDELTLWGVDQNSSLWAVSTYEFNNADGLLIAEGLVDVIADQSGSITSYLLNSEGLLLVTSENLITYYNVISVENNMIRVSKGTGSVSGSGDSDSVNQLFFTSKSAAEEYLKMPILKTSSGTFDGNQNYVFKGEILDGGVGSIMDFGFVFSQQIISSDEDIWISASGLVSNLNETTNFSLTLQESPFDGDFYFKSWAKNSVGYREGSVKKMIISVEADSWLGVTEEMTGGWRQSSWFGAFREYENDWIFHLRLGWLYAKSTTDGGVWLWREEDGWLWTKSDAWPYFWSAQFEDWLYLYPESVSDKPVFYNFNTKENRH